MSSMLHPFLHPVPIGEGCMDQVKEMALEFKILPLEESGLFEEKLMTKMGAEVLEERKSTVGVESYAFLGQENFTFSHELID